MRLPSGIRGFDEMVQGGLPLGTSVVLQGPPGQEKLRFALTFLAEGLKTGSSGLVVVSSQSPDAILSELRSLGVDLDKVVEENRLRIVDWYTQREEPVQDVEERGIVLRSSIDLTNVGVALSRAIAALGGDRPKRAVVELLSPATSVYELGQVYAFAQSSKGKFVRFNFTALVLIEKEMHAAADLSTLHQPFDGVLEIERVRVGDQIVRKLGVLHLKDTTPDSAFRVLEADPEGLRIVREPTKAPAAATPSAIPPPRTALREEPRRAAPPASPKPAGASKPAVFETKEESPTRAYLIMQIARERLKLNPSDADALFAMAAAQATLDDARGALEGLERLSKIDDRYPGLWVLKTKLHARLGEVEKARQSRVRAEQAEEWEGEELMVPCPICETPVAEGASRCPKCGATFLTDAKMTDELDALGHAMIQEKVTEELGTGPIVPPERPPRPPEKPRPEPAVRPEGLAPKKPGAKQGLTNGFVRERRADRPAGMTNGLRGRTNGLTNGLRGRTNGLTNGMGRTNGLTNGLRGRTNGLTNGLGRTNGLTNGMGRTNGLTNGLVSLRRGITNGLTNGNGFTNGLGSPRFQREIRLNQWKLYIIPVVVVGLLIIPLFLPPDYGGSLYPIRIDGDFSDWSVASLIGQTVTAAIDANVDIQRFGTFDNGDRLAFYVEVRGSALTGGGVPARYDTLWIFLDTDLSPATGYLVAGMGADRLIEVSGWGNRVNRTSFAEWDTNRAPIDWNGWIKSTSIPAATLGSRLELEVNWDLIAAPKAPVGVYAYFQSHLGTFDETDAVLNPAGGSLLVRVFAAPPEILAGTDVGLVGLDLTAYGGDVTYSDVTVTIIGTALPSTLGALRLVDSGGGTLQERIPIARDVTFQFPPRTVAAGQSETLFVRGDILGAAAETLGIAVDAPGDIVATPAFVTVQQRPALRTVGYLGVVPSGHRVDGGFSDWTNVSLDPVDVGTRADVDLREYGFDRTASTVDVLVGVGGRAFQGVVVPEASAAAAGSPPIPGSADSDRDTVPDVDDPMPFDFNNDGTDDVSTGNDYDGDGVTDYPAGADYYLNTTIPGTFPPAYANRSVSLYIGPSVRPALYGEDVARVFLDADNDPSTGFRINVLGADYLLEFRGRYGFVTYRELNAFAGAGPLEWTWTPVLSPAAAWDYSRIEASFPSAGLGFANNSIAYFEVTDWTLNKDASLDPIFRIGRDGAGAGSPSYSPGSVHTLDISGNEKWFFTSGSTTATSCTTNLAASTTAGSSATSTTVSTDTNTVCWFTPLGQPTTTAAGSWEVILDISKTDAMKGFLPNAQGTHNAWTIGTGCTSGNEYQCVDEDPNDGDTSYLESTGSTNVKATFNLADWVSPPSPLTITNVKASIWCRSPSNPTGSIATLIKNGSNEQQGSSTTCPTGGYTEILTNYANYPWGTPRAWTVTDVNNLEAGAVDADTQSRTMRLSEVKVTVSYAPVYSVEIFKCQQETCTSGTTLYTSSNSASYGSDITFTTGSIAAQTLSANQRFRFKVTLVSGGADGGSFAVSYNGASGGSSDSRATISIPEFGDVAIPIGASLAIAVLVERSRRRAAQRRPGGTRDPLDVPRQ